MSQPHKNLRNIAFPRLLAQPSGSISGMRAPLLLLTLAVASSAVATQEPPLKPGMAESPTIKVLKGLTVPEFEQEMQGFVQALGITCAFCHVRNNFPADTNEHKVVARRMIEMTKLINQQFFPAYQPAEGESKLGKVTCMTCHQGNEKPKIGQ